MFSDVTGNMITQEDKKQQLSSKLAQNMLLSVFNITVGTYLGKCTNPPHCIPLFFLFTQMHAGLQLHVIALECSTGQCHKFS